MRFAVLMLSALMLSACEPIPTPEALGGGAGKDGPAKATERSDGGLSITDTAFDYRYAFRLAPGRVAATQEAHAKACDQLGPQRCLITTMRYKVLKDNEINAVLTMKLDPAAARAFGQAAVGAVLEAKGVLIDADIAGADALSAGGRADTVTAKLRAGIDNARAQLRGEIGPVEKAALEAKIERYRVAIATINEVEQGAGNSAATTPVIFTYTSGGAIPGLGGTSEASFDAAGQTFLQSLGELATVLAGVGPWAVFLLGGALILRRLLNEDEEPAAPAPPAPARDGDEDGGVNGGGFFRRLLGRDDDAPANPNPAE